MSTPAKTASLYAALEQVLGREPAETLMGQLPAGGRIASKDDLDVLEVTLRRDFETRFDAVDKRFDAVDKRFEQVDKRFVAVDRRFEQIDDHFQAIEDRLHQLHFSMHGYARTFVVAQVTSIFGAVGLFFGINQLI